MDPSGTVDRVGAICRRFRIDSLAPQLAACEEMLGDGGVVDVAVLGQFKAGKSSFLNALIGVPVVPVDVLPSTAVVTRIGYGARERVIVHGNAGDPFEIPQARLAEFVTERGNPANEKRVAVVDVELPSLAPYEGVRFVDTPGMGSVFAAQHAGVEGVDAPRRRGPRRRQRQPPPLRGRPAAPQRRVLAYSRGGSPVDEGGPGVRGGARLGDRIHPQPGDFPDGEGVEGSPRLQPSRLRGDARESGGVPAGTDRGAAGGGVRGDRGSQGPCAGRRRAGNT